jgi:hypothetical protein
MSFKFEKYTTEGKQHRNPVISLSKIGEFYINKAAYNKFFKEFKYAIFYYDREQKAIGIEPTNEVQAGIHAIRLRRKGTVARISAKGFLKHFSIDYNVSRKYFPRLEGKIIVLSR